MSPAGVRAVPSAGRHRGYVNRLSLKVVYAYGRSGMIIPLHIECSLHV